MHPALLPHDNSVAVIYHPGVLEHDTGHHPESAARISAILSALEEIGVKESDLLKPQPAGADMVAQVHYPPYVETVEKASAEGGGFWDPDTYISPGTYQAALCAVGTATAAVDSVMSGSRAAFALVRPPGHHALYMSAMGFCIFNNVAVAAHYATRKYGLERVLIVDWDVHHGNGTQDLFYTRSDVLFFSVHRSPFYPGTGSMEETGAAGGRGYTVNVPLRAGVGDIGYKRVFDHVLVPLARRYRPQLILISAGYDAHVADPLGGMAVTLAGFEELSRVVRMLADEIPDCDGRVAAVLEGGYNVEALASSVIGTVGVLGTPHGEASRHLHAEGKLGSFPSRPAPDAAQLLSVAQVITSVRQIHGLQDNPRQ